MTPLTEQDIQHLRLLTIFHYVAAGLGALWACFPVIHLVMGVAMISGAFGAGKDAPPAAVGWIFIAFALAFMACGFGLAFCLYLAGKSIAARRRHVYCLVVAGIQAMFCMPIGTALGVFTFIVLLRPAVKAAFEAARGSECPA